MRRLLTISCLLMLFASQALYASQVRQYNTFSLCNVAQADEKPAEGETKPAKKEGEAEPDCD